MKDSNKTKCMALKSNNVISIHASPEVDFELELAALLLDEKSNPHNEKDFVFYNNPVGAGVKYEMKDLDSLSRSFIFEPNKLPARVNKIDFFCFCYGSSINKPFVLKAFIGDSPVEIEIPKLPDGGMVKLFSLCRMENGFEIKTKKPKKYKLIADHLRELNLVCTTKTEQNNNDVKINGNY